MEDQSAKGVLLSAVVEHFARQGLADQSLRHIAAAVGSSHRMLLYHFGSKDGLLVEVVRAVEERTRVLFGAISADSGGASDEVIRRVWAHVADPALSSYERLFFALYGRALQGDPAIAPLWRGELETWLEANAVLAAAQGVSAELARTHARLGLAVIRGLLLDLLATGDRAGADAALEAFASRYAGRWWEPQAAGGDASAVKARAS
ncbi:MAG TPA: TetR/AcrR family transcriptional regulator [Acidimicrobiales bacterium]|jgi:AcrR family transcriptional regulator|nr:TetR/AcrR family transcriptional regulator [Acidimicrobiales bacterium]